MDDKRLLVVESEFASVLKMCAREGNVLSAVLRQAWDSQDLQILTKNSPHRATRPHISLVGHITRDELVRSMTETEHANGFGNRFLWVHVRRSKLLPDGGGPSSWLLESLIADLFRAVDFATKVGVMQRDEGARDLWHEIYPKLSGDRPGMHGAITARAEAQTMRIACLYALLGMSSVICVQHLQAALALWAYAESSAGLVFGESLGDHSADTILRALRTRGRLTRTQINGLFQRNQKASEIERALGVLRGAGLATSFVEDGAGRSSEVWTAT